MIKTKNNKNEDIKKTRTQKWWHEFGHILFRIFLGL